MAVTGHPGRPDGPRIPIRELEEFRWDLAEVFAAGLQRLAGPRG